MVDINLNIDINTVCNICEKDVEVEYMGYELIVSPCVTCLGKQEDESYNEGYNDGLNENKD